MRTCPLALRCRPGATGHRAGATVPPLCGNTRSSSSLLHGAHKRRARAPPHALANHAHVRARGAHVAAAASSATSARRTPAPPAPPHASTRHAHFGVRSWICCLTASISENSSRSRRLMAGTVSLRTSAAAHRGTARSGCATPWATSRAAVVTSWRSRVGVELGVWRASRRARACCGGSCGRAGIGTEQRAHEERQRRPACVARAQHARGGAGHERGGAGGGQQRGREPGEVPGGPLRAVAAIAVVAVGRRSLGRARRRRPHALRLVVHGRCSRARASWFSCVGSRKPPCHLRLGRTRRAPRARRQGVLLHLAPALVAREVLRLQMHLAALCCSHRRTPHAHFGAWPNPSGRRARRTARRSRPCEHDGASPPLIRAGASGSRRLRLPLVPVKLMWRFSSGAGGAPPPAPPPPKQDSSDEDEEEQGVFSRWGKRLAGYFGKVCACTSAAGHALLCSVPGSRRSGRTVNPAAGSDGGEQAGTRTRRPTGAHRRRNAAPRCTAKATASGRGALCKARAGGTHARLYLQKDSQAGAFPGSSGGASRLDPAPHSLKSNVEIEAATSQKVIGRHRLSCRAGLNPERLSAGVREMCGGTPLAAHTLRGAACLHACTRTCSGNGWSSRPSWATRWSTWSRGRSTSSRPSTSW